MLLDLSVAPHHICATLHFGLIWVCLYPRMLYLCRFCFKHNFVFLFKLQLLVVGLEMFDPTNLNQIHDLNLTPF